MISKRCINAIENANEPIAFVLGSYLTSGLGIVRNLGKTGITTVVFASDKNQLSFYSKYATGIICPHPKNNEMEYVNFLLEVGERLNEKGVLLPISDTDTIAILKNREKLKKYYRFTSAKWDVVKEIVNKNNFYNLLEKKDLPHPKTYFPSSSNDIKTISKEITYPCILKPVYSSYFVLDFHTKLFLARTKEELIRHYEKAISKNHEVNIQEIIPGDAHVQYGLNAYYNRKFNPTGVFMYRRIREWPHNFGNGCFIESVWQQELEEIITPLMKEIKYYGIVDAEFRKDPRDDLFKIIEINPRTWMQNSLSSRCGINIPYLAYKDAIRKPLEKTNPINKNVKWLYMLDDLKSSMKNIRKGKLSLQEWINSFKGEKEYAVFACNDPIPFFVLCAKSTFFPFKYLLKRSQ